MSGIPALPLTGAKVALTIYLAGNALQQTDNAESVQVTEQVVQYRDKLLNRFRDRTDEQTIGYDAKIVLQYAGAQIVSALLAQKAARQANQAVPELSVGLVLANRDGTFHGYILQRGTSKMDINISGKDDRVKHTLDLQFEDLAFQATL